MSPERKRLTYALLLSLLVHTWLLSLTFGGQGLWFPGFGFPWQHRQVEALDLRVVVGPAQVTAAEPAVTPVAEPMLQARVQQPVDSEPAATPSVSRPPQPRTATAIVPRADSRPKTNPRKYAAPDATPAQVPLGGDRRDDSDAVSPPIAASAVIPSSQTDEATAVVPVTPATPAPVSPEASSASSPGTATPSLQDAGDAARSRIDQEVPERDVEPAKLDPSKTDEPRQTETLEAARQDAVRQEAARAENARLEVERQAAERRATDLQEAARQEAARAEAARAEAARAEAARAEAARAEAARAEAARAEAARAEAARAEAARAEAARAEAARAEAARAEAAREERLKAIGRQLDAEAAQREAAAAAARQSPALPPWRSARRYRLFGRTDPNSEIILYAEAWARKIQLNTPLDVVREAAKQPHTDPLVTVAIRSDGSVESVTIVQSSGVVAIDDAIRRIIDSQKPYQAFPPGLAREWDVIEIRRTWYFDVAIRLY